MVIGKDKKRIKELETQVAKLNTQITSILQAISDSNAKYNELAETVANSIEDNKSKKSPQQLMKEWFMGGDDE